MTSARYFSPAFGKIGNESAAESDTEWTLIDESEGDEDIVSLPRSEHNSSPTSTESAASDQEAGRDDKLRNSLEELMMLAEIMSRTEQALARERDDDDDDDDDEEEEEEEKEEQSSYREEQAGNRDSGK
ncbi:hypothetical protein M406DRAFT_73961 [Cryphonectria parasitica EP155]|uniref:Uncharacterized protein n=1 Tax=Cryphonectria parasitica (strain ATCC 38755 / EP155) TaxID=660469 RepID=A0A9P4XYP8_CRYP1|nr:uncharacterized protein M406DRAFT_73961 [Cryphonectria parasitica EP155]KAF3763343.1 hypothetical protein M406DRAFT_73961 [Cryphonectria parasitica EP155]